MKANSVLDCPLDALQQFLKTEAASGVLLLLAAVVALVLANSGLSRAFDHAVHLPFALGTGTLAIGTTLQHAVNDGLMAIFFLVVGLEIKREFLTGELSGRGAAILPVAAAFGGAVVPALLYFAWNAGGPASHGWGIPMATDIAFAVGILALVGSRVPPAFKVFLTALAVVDDLIAVGVIAIFYAGGLDSRALALVAAAFAALLGLNRARVRVLTPYLAIGVVMWAAMAKSGVHPTVAGVLLAFTLPAGGGRGRAPSPSRPRPSPVVRVSHHAGLRARKYRRDPGAGVRLERPRVVDRARNHRRPLRRTAGRHFRSE